MGTEDIVNIFNTYKRENSFTNGLFSLLQLSIHERPHLVATFLNELLHITPKGKKVDFSFDVRVLSKIDHADAELRCGNCCLRFETKIRSGDLRHEQVARRLRELRRCSGRLKRVVLLTPDDRKSSYIKEILSNYKPSVLHLEWKQVHDFLEKSVGQSKGTYSELVRQFLSRIKEQVFERDFAGVITKIAFNSYTGVDSESYLKELPKDTAWNTPRPYKELDGTGRKLLLYDGVKKGITAEVEIKKVKHIRWERSFPSRNVFAGKPTIFKKPITLKQIRSVSGFNNFGKPKGKDRNPYRNITREKYRYLMSGCEARNSSIR